MNKSLPEKLTIENIAQNPEGIEFDKSDGTFLLSNMNAGPVVKIAGDGSFTPFTSGEQFPLSTAGLQIDYAHGRLLVAAFNGNELLDEDPNTHGVAYLRIYDLGTGVMIHDVELSSHAPGHALYFANDIAVDQEGNAYVSDWYAGLVYKVDLDGNASLFWTNETGVPSGPNGLDCHPDGYLLVSLVSVNDQGLYADYGLVKIPVTDPESAELVGVLDEDFRGFDGMVLTPSGHVVGVSNDGVSPGGSSLLELSSDDGWATARVLSSAQIAASTTVAITPGNEYYVINQDFSNALQESWTIERVTLSSLAN